MTKIFPVLSKTIRDITEKEEANSPLPSTEESQNPHDLKTYLCEPIIMPNSFTGFEQFVDIILFNGQVVF